MFQSNQVSTESSESAKFSMPTDIVSDLQDGFVPTLLSRMNRLQGGRIKSLEHIFWI